MQIHANQAGLELTLDKLRYIRYALSITLTVLFLLHIANILHVPFLEALENQSYDARLKQLLPYPAEKQVVIIDIDEKSLGTLGHWPWNRNVMASIVDILFDHYQIKALGFDIVFAEADEDDAAMLLRQMANGPLKNDKAFLSEYSKAAQIIHRDARFSRSLENRNTILGFVMDTGTHKGMLPRPAGILDRSTTGRIPFVISRGYTANLKILQKNAQGAGFFDNPLLDNDGVYRRIPLLQQYESALYESLALALTRAVLGSPDIEIIVESSSEDTNEILLEWIKIGDIRIPVDERAGVLVPYIGKQKSFTYLSAVDILNKIIPVDVLRGKIALLGTSAAGLHDLRTTPLEAAYPGVEIHANIIQGILDQTILYQPGYTAALEFILLLTLGLTLIFLLPLLSPLWGLIVSSSLLILLITGNLAIWSSYRLVLPIASPVLFIILMYTLHMTYGFFVENRNKRKLTHLFGQYVPPALVDEISRKMEDIKLDGEIREMSVLFSDVRNFTTISEDMAPEQITRLINSILTPLTEVIHQQRGTIDKYMGDAVMAFWGAPLEDAEHARHALTAAINMIQRINQLKAEFAAQGWPEISIGIGINSGEMNVGNKGSAFRVDYTVLGDAVNLASRLEGLTRIYDVDIIAGENTRHAVPEFTFRELDRVRVKGKNKTITIYEPLGPTKTIDEFERKELERFHLGLEYYRQCKWDNAEQILSSLGNADPQRKIYRIYLDRIDHYRGQPPADDWDGSFTQNFT
jgi:adenylate cyclase